MQVDLLVFGPHPDDIEIGLGGAVAMHVQLGYRVGLCDLTRGEMGSNGTVEERLAEARDAAEVLGVQWRENLGWPDGEVGEDRAHVRCAVEFIRRCRPSTVAVPYWRDRHPDHVSASRLLTNAAFRSGLRRYPADEPAWRPDWVCYYFINDSVSPSFVVDCSEYYDLKRRALDCHRSQFRPSSADAVTTRLTSPCFRQMIEARDSYFGAIAGVRFAEGVVVREPIARPSLFRATVEAHGKEEPPG